MGLIQQGVSIDLQQYIPMFVNAIATTLLFVVVFLVAYRLGRSVVTGAVENSLKRRDFDETLVGFAASMTAVVMTVFAAALAAAIAGFGTVLAAFATLGGALTLAIGFAAQDLIANFVAGVFLIKDKTFTVGDWIEWNGGDGVVREIHLRVTKLDTLDNQLMTVPNSDLANATVTNNVANDRRRVAVGFGVEYDEDLTRARNAIVEEGASIDGVLDIPRPTAPLAELGDSSVILSGRVWIDPSENSYPAVRSQFAEAVKDRFDAEGIDIPYPNTELSGDLEVTNVAPVEGNTGD
ncbi:small-conductance mechanosensitive channel [Halorubrum coriense DSM 10284]|uniref:Small-conductance mechanosensitive channel n=1 Tax=Halorubrum coriense DSM 10284 TaxID=1227466 RepID=M0EKP1_9EURY|nr:mechanosensitive ion channel family protein [Halorubrum coriense]ELZ46974.1 small-conductance mechanosensitive channel [Halorubrum coriense DSM 10284]